MDTHWIARLHRELLELRQPGAGWGNRAGGGVYVEPTALAVLALAASDSDRDVPPSRQALIEACDWLVTLQQPDGALGLAAHLPRPRWTTPLAIFAWLAAGRAQAACSKAVDWLLTVRGGTRATATGTPFGHDPQIPGWPWVEGTQSWLEPTALAVLALRRAGLAGHARTRDGQRLVRDRAIRTGGWNYGNSTVFGADLRPHPAPTGLALLALAGAEDFDGPLVARGCAYLEKILPATHAAQSLCFGTLALSAWNRRPPEADDWLTRAQESAVRRPDSIAQRAYLLLAAGTRSLELLGVTGGPNS